MIPEDELEFTFEDLDPSRSVVCESPQIVFQLHLQIVINKAHLDIN